MQFRILLYHISVLYVLIHTNKLCMAIFLLLYTVATVQLILPAIQSSCLHN